MLKHSIKVCPFHLNHTETMKSQFSCAVRTDQTWLHIKDIRIKISEVKPVIGVLLSVKTNVDNQHFGRGVWRNNARQGAILHNPSWHNNLITCLVCEFDFGLTIPRALKVVSIDNEGLVLWVSRNHVIRPDLSDKRSLENLDCLIQILPVIAIRRNLKLGQSTVVSSGGSALHFVFSCLLHVHCRPVLLIMQVYVSTLNGLVWIRLELVKEHAFNIYFSMASVRNGGRVNTSDEEVLVVLKGVELITVVNSFILSILLTVSGD